MAICDILDKNCQKNFLFELESHSHKWIDTKIRVRIVKLKKIDREKWIIIGDWLDAELKERPCSFKGTYSTASKTGEFVFSFKYGHLEFDEEMKIFRRGILNDE